MKWKCPDALISVPARWGQAPRRRSAFCAALVLLLGLCRGHAQWLTQTNVIVPGWSAIYLNVDPSSQANLIPGTPGLPLAYGNPIDQIWLWKYPAGNAQYVANPLSPLSGGGQWLTWALNSTNSANTLSALIPNTAYLVHNSSATNFIWTVKGQPVAPSYTWDITGLNFIGFPTPYNNPPTFQNYFAQDPAIASVVQYFAYTGGPFSILNPQQIFSPAITTVNRGQAYWVSATNVNNTYFGPFKVTLPNAQGIVFGANAGQETIHLINVTTNRLTITAQLFPSETPPAGQANIVGAPPLLLEGVLNSSNLTYSYYPMGTGTSNSWTLPPFGTPGCDIQVVIGVNRYALTNAAGALYAGFLRFTDSLGFSDVDVPVSAVSANNAGLWVGGASITQVGSYMKSYATNLDGTYAFTKSTNYFYATNPASALITANLLSISRSSTNTAVTYYDTNQLTVNNYVVYTNTFTTNAFALSTNFIVTEAVATNVTVQTNITGFYYSGGSLVFTTTNTYSTQTVVTAASSALVTVTNPVPLTPGNFSLSTQLSAQSALVQVVLADVNGDGRPDLITANNGGNGFQNLSVFLNQSNGIFGARADYNSSNFTAAVAVGDVNNDGKPDLIAANNAVSTLSLLTNNGAGVFTAYKSISLSNAPTYVTAVDVNNDGRPDLLVTEGGGTIVVLTNNGSGGFIQSASLAGTGKFAVADVNKDNLPDLIATGNSGNNLVVYTNAGKGQFGLAASPAVAQGGFPVVLAVDVNQDGWVDLIATSAGNSVVVLTNSAGNGFVPSATNYIGSTGDSIRSIATADVNGDGYPDYVCADFTASQQVVLTNDQAGGFAVCTTISVASTPVGVAVADLNNDSRADIISANNYNNSSPTLSVLTNYAVTPTNGLPVTVANLTITNFYTTSLLTAYGIQYGPVTNLVLTSNYSITNALAVTNNEQVVVTAIPVAATNYSIASYSPISITPVTYYNNAFYGGQQTSFTITNGALLVLTNVTPGFTNIVLGSTNLVNGVTNIVFTVTNVTLPVTNWISYNVSTNITYATNYAQVQSITNTLVVSNYFAIQAGATNYQGSASNWLVNSSLVNTTITLYNSTNISLIVATNPAISVTATNFVVVTNTAYVVTGLNTNMGAVPTAFPLRLIVFNDGTNSTLLQRVYYGIRQNTNLVVATTESVLDAAHLSSARRISCTSLPWTPNNTVYPFSGQLLQGGTLTTTVTDAYDDQAANPFLHTYHPDHNNLDLTVNPPKELPLGSQSYNITRVITLTVAPNTADFITLTTANSTIAGYYQETTTLTGLGGATRTFSSSGTFALKQISPIATLTTQ